MGFVVYPTLGKWQHFASKCISLSRFVCLVIFFIRYDQYCADHYANGHCNQGCNTEECGWDGLDCTPDTSPKLARGMLVIVVLLQPEELLGDIRGFLRSLGTLLHTNLRLKQDEQQKPMVYPYYGIEEDESQDGVTTMKQRGKRELGREVIGYVFLKPTDPNKKWNSKGLSFKKYHKSGLDDQFKQTNHNSDMSLCFRSKVFLEIDNRQCSQHSNECISSADQAASFIAAEYLKNELQYPLHSVTSMYTTKRHFMAAAKQ